MAFLQGEGHPAFRCRRLCGILASGRGTLTFFLRHAPDPSGRRFHPMEIIAILSLILSAIYTFSFLYFEATRH
jgi:hypothetical protein